jgi:hypothetical protein
MPIASHASTQRSAYCYLQCKQGVERHCQLCGRREKERPKCDGCCKTVCKPCLGRVLGPGKQHESDHLDAWLCFSCDFSQLEGLTPEHERFREVKAGLESTKGLVRNEDSKNVLGPRNQEGIEKVISVSEGERKRRTLEDGLEGKVGLSDVRTIERNGEESSQGGSGVVNVGDGFGKVMQAEQVDEPSWSFIDSDRVVDSASKNAAGLQTSGLMGDLGKNREGGNRQGIREGLVKRGEGMAAREGGGLQRDLFEVERFLGDCLEGGAGLQTPKTERLGGESGHQGGLGAAEKDEKFEEAKATTRGGTGKVSAASEVVGYLDALEGYLQGMVGSQRSKAVGNPVEEIGRQRVSQQGLVEEKESGGLGGQDQRGTQQSPIQGLVEQKASGAKSEKVDVGVTKTLLEQGLVERKEGDAQSGGKEGRMFGCAACEASRELSWAPHLPVRVCGDCLTAYNCADFGVKVRLTDCGVFTWRFRGHVPVCLGVLIQLAC